MKTLAQVIGAARSYEYIFVIVKPGFLELCPKIESMFAAEGWSVAQTRVTTLTPEQAKALYIVHKDKDFYDDLCTYMSSAPSRAYIYKRFGSRTSSHTFKSVSDLKDRIRDKWGQDDCKNVLHSSDSFSAMEHEKSIYF